MGLRLVFLVVARPLSVFLLSGCWTLSLSCVEATPENEARVTRVVKEVKLEARGIARSVALGDRAPDGAVVSTGVDSQAELTFADRTLARLGGKTAFSFSDGTHHMDLRSGAMLVRVPASSWDSEIQVAGATVVVTGTTCLLEHNTGKYVKLVVLEGTARMFLKDRLGESVLVKEGQLLMFHLGPMPMSLPNPVDIDLKRLMATSTLIKGFAPLGNESSIGQGIAGQKKAKTEGALVDTNLVIFGRGTVVSLVDPATVGNDQKNVRATPTPTPRRR